MDQGGGAGAAGQGEGAPLPSASNDSTKITMGVTRARALIVAKASRAERPVGRRVGISAEA
jgi:hypothetical protein